MITIRKQRKQFGSIPMPLRSAFTQRSLPPSGAESLFLLCVNIKLRDECNIVSIWFELVYFLINLNGCPPWHRCAGPCPRRNKEPHTSNQIGRFMQIRRKKLTFEIDQNSRTAVKHVNSQLCSFVPLQFWQPCFISQYKTRQCLHSVCGR